MTFKKGLPAFFPSFPLCALGALCGEIFSGREETHPAGVFLVQIN
jgi:hypothetical protein